MVAIVTSGRGVSLFRYHTNTFFFVLVCTEQACKHSISYHPSTNQSSSQEQRQWWPFVFWLIMMCQRRIYPFSPFSWLNQECTHSHMHSPRWANRMINWSGFDFLANNRIETSSENDKNYTDSWSLHNLNSLGSSCDDCSGSVSQRAIPRPPWNGQLWRSILWWVEGWTPQFNMEILFFFVFLQLGWTVFHLIFKFQRISDSMLGMR